MVFMYVALKQMDGSSSSGSLTVFFLLSFVVVVLCLRRQIVYIYSVNFLFCLDSVGCLVTFYVIYSYIQVSFANVVDIDCGGLDTLASQYKLSIGNYLR